MIRCDGCGRQITAAVRDGSQAETEIGLMFNPPPALALPAVHFCLNCTSRLYASWIGQVQASHEEYPEKISKRE